MRGRWRRCVPLGDAFLKCRAFCRGAARYERGRCAHAAAAKLREVLREYLVLVAQLETVVRSGIPNEDACDALVELIKENDRWVEPSEVEEEELVEA